MYINVIERSPILETITKICFEYFARKPFVWNILRAATARKGLKPRNLQPGNRGGHPGTWPQPEQVSKPSLEEVMQ